MTYSILGNAAALDFIFTVSFCAHLSQYRKTDSPRYVSCQKIFVCWCQFRVYQDELVSVYHNRIHREYELTHKASNLRPSSPPLSCLCLPSACAHYRPSSSQVQTIFNTSVCLTMMQCVAMPDNFIYLAVELLLTKRKSLLSLQHSN